jgi:hypothetical protein
MMYKFSRNQGVGEVYRIRAQIRLIEQLHIKYELNRILEFPPDPVSMSYPETLNWLPTLDPGVSADMLFTWRAFPHTVKRMIAEFPGNFIMLMGTNRLNPGVFFQKLFWIEPEHYALIRDLKIQLHEAGLEIVDSGFYDCPPWFDAPLPLNLHLPVAAGGSRMLDFWEKFPVRIVRAHHVWALGRRK